MNKDFAEDIIEVSKLVFSDQNLVRYFAMLFWHYLYDFDNQDFFLEFEYELSKINNLLSDPILIDRLKDEQITMALSNRYMAYLFYLSFFAEETKETKEIIGLLNNSPTMERFINFSSEPFSDNLKMRNKKEEWKFEKENLIKKNIEQLKAADLSISMLEDENEQLKQRIEKSKKIWDENKKLKEENEKLKLMLKNYEKN